MFRSDVVGSLLRPDYLTDARQRLEAGDIGAAAFKKVEDQAVDEAIRLQEDAGLEVVSDGEQRRYAFFGHLVDAPQYAALLDPEIRAGYEQRGSDVDEMIDRTIELDNAVISPFRSQGVTFGLHICRGNNQSTFYASGGYDPIAERVFRKTLCDRFLLEYDDERSGTFEPLRFVPEDRVVVLGLVTTKKPRVEGRDELERRVHQAAGVVPLERLALSPQCGFASTWEGNRITSEQQRRKLEVVAETAKSIWG